MSPVAGAEPPGDPDGVSPNTTGSERAVGTTADRVREFLRLEATGGAALLAATAAALLWANLGGDSYTSFWTRPLPHELGPIHLPDTPRAWVADGFMAVYFFVAGLEIKRELSVGELRDRRIAAFPVAGALGGMLVPALIYASINPHGPEARGWGIPMATDIAFALAVLAVVGRGLPTKVRAFLLSLAIVDDIGAVVVIAVFYSSGIRPVWLLAGGLFALVTYAGFQVRGTQYSIALLGGLGMWLALHEAGVHPTMAGVAAGLLAPATRAQAPGPESLPAHTASPVRSAASPEPNPEPNPEPEPGWEPESDGQPSVVDLLTDLVHPWSTYLVAPLFALASAGVVFSGDSVRQILTSSVSLGVLLGLVVGKPVGVMGGCWIADRLGLAQRPRDIEWSHVAGIGAVAGIGFTVSLLVAGLAFPDGTSARTHAELAVLGAAVLAACAAGVTFRFAPRRVVAGTARPRP